jgi:hypothetical protein
MYASIRSWRGGVEWVVVVGHNDGAIDEGTDSRLPSKVGLGEDELLVTLSFFLESGSLPIKRVEVVEIETLARQSNSSVRVDSSEIFLALDANATRNDSTLEAVVTSRIVTDGLAARGAATS